MRWRCTASRVAAGPRPSAVPHISCSCTHVTGSRALRPLRPFPLPRKTVRCTHRQTMVPSGWAGCAHGPHCCQPQRDLARADCFTPAPKKTFRAHESKTARLLLAPRTIWGGLRALKWSGFVPAWMSWLSAGANVARNSGRLCGERLGGLPCTQRPLCTVTASSKHSV